MTIDPMKPEDPSGEGRVEEFQRSEDPPAEGGRPAFVRIGLYFYGAMLGAALIWRVGIYGESIFFIDAAAAVRGVRWLPDLGLGLATGITVVAVSGWLTRLTGWGDRLARALAQRIGALGVPDAVLLAFASGLAEEFFFRGALQPRVGFWLAGLLFGCVHFVPRREFLPWTGFAVVAGLLFGALFIQTGNLLAPVTAHVVVNGINLPLLVRQYRDEAEASGVD